ncbi:MAG: HDIG domain-containing metalloprotein [Chloroflexia bacterium]
MTPFQPDDERLFETLSRAADPPAARASLTALLLRPDPRPSLAALEASGLLARFLPEVAVLRGVSQLPDHEMDALDHSLTSCSAAPRTRLSRWTALLHDIGKATTVIRTPEGRTRFFGHESVGAELGAGLLARLGFAPPFASAADRLIRLHLRPLAYSPTWTDSAVLRLQAEAGALWPALLAQCRADLLGYSPEPVDRALDRLDELAARALRLANPPPAPPGSPLDGNELQALLGLPPGPWLREVKAMLLREVRSGRLPPGNKAGAAALARLWWAQRRS